MVAGDILDDSQQHDFTQNIDKEVTWVELHFVGRVDSQTYPFVVPFLHVKIIQHKKEILQRT